jgi:(+)-trans-carveol dehydrogenase
MKGRSNVGRLDGKVAVISGAARGQGRSHAVTLAREGADIVAFDICAPLRFPLYPGATVADLEETARLVEAQGRRCLNAVADARDLPGLTALADRAVEEFGGVDILVANHGIWTVAPNSWELEEDSWLESIDVNLTGTWKVLKAFTPKIIAGGRGGVIVLIGSANGIRPQPAAIAYSTAKAGLLAMMRVLTHELGRLDIRVNAVNPGSIDTPMVSDGSTMAAASAFQARYWQYVASQIHLPIGIQPAQSVSDAILWLVSDEARYVTGAAISVDAGWASS